MTTSGDASVGRMASATGRASRALGHASGSDSGAGGVAHEPESRIGLKWTSEHRCASPASVPQTSPGGGFGSPRLFTVETGTGGVHSRNHPATGRDVRPHPPATDVHGVVLRANLTPSTGPPVNQPQGRPGSSARSSDIERATCRRGGLENMSENLYPKVGCPRMPVHGVRIPQMLASATIRQHIFAGLRIAIGAASGMKMAQSIRLEDLATQIPVIPEPKASAYIESCKVSFDHHNHPAGTSMEVDLVHDHHGVSVRWDGEVTDIMRRACADVTKRVDEGTCVIALLLLARFVNLVAVEVSQKRNGIDYYLASPDNDNFNDEHLIFNHTAVLEVSGIQTTRGSTTIARRVKEKKDRLIRYSTSTTSQTVDLPTYICVVEFSAPEAQVTLV